MNETSPEGATISVEHPRTRVVAMLLGYVCAKLGVRYPSSGGLITDVRGLEFWAQETGHPQLDEGD